MNQHTTCAITGRTELSLNQALTFIPARGERDAHYLIDITRSFTLADQEGRPYEMASAFILEQYDHLFVLDEPHPEPDAYPEYAPYTPCEQQAFVTDTPEWTVVTTYDISDHPVPFDTIPVGAEFYDAFAKDVVRKTSALRGVVVASDDSDAHGLVYGYIASTIPMNDNVYPVLTHTAQHLAEGPSAQDLLVAQEWAPGSPADALLQAEWFRGQGFRDPPADHPEGWNAPASLAPDSPETHGVKVTYKVSQGNCYRLFHHGRQIALVPNYAQGEVIAQALASVFAGRLADFSLTLDFIEGATP